MQQETLTGLDIATLVIAIVGAVTGIAALVAQVWAFVASGYRIRVRQATSILVPQGGVALSVNAANVGRMPVTITGAGFLFGDDLSIPIIHGMNNAPVFGPTFPHRLIDGDSAAWIVDPAIIVSALMQEGGGHLHVRAFVNLADGERKTAKKTIDAVHAASLNRR